jgi:Na+/phosphate symporter
VLRIYKKKAIFKILDILTIKTVVGLSCLCLLLTTIKLMSFTLLTAYKDRLRKIIKAVTSANNLSGAGAHSA